MLMCNGVNGDRGGGVKEEIENSAQRLSATLDVSNAAAYPLDSTKPPVIFYRHIESTESDGNAVRVSFSCCLLYTSDAADE